MTEKVIVFGNTDLSALSHFYLTHDSPYEVVAFTTDAAYMREPSFCGLPIVAFERLEEHYPPEDFALSILLGFRDVNRLRARKYAEAKAKGYRCVSYVSSKAIVWPGVELGENCYIHENVVLQPFSTIADSVVIAPGAVVGHHNRVADHCFLATRATLLGNITVEPYCVLGANCTILDGVTIGRECIIGAGALITKSTAPGGIYTGRAAERLPKTSREMGSLLTWSRDLKRDKS